MHKGVQLKNIDKNLLSSTVFIFKKKEVSSTERYCFTLTLVLEIRFNWKLLSLHANDDYDRICFFLLFSKNRHKKNLILRIMAINFKRMYSYKNWRMKRHWIYKIKPTHCMTFSETEKHWRWQTRNSYTIFCFIQLNRENTS